MPGLNDFVIRFANVNGTGSASANGMVAKSFYRMGLPIGPKNMFPSNIQGLPTWYEIRVNEHGFTGRRGGVDIMVAMNPQTFVQDHAEVSGGGFLMYDSARQIRSEDRRADVTYLGVPFTELSLPEFPNAKSRALLKNIVYVGALAAFLDIPMDVLHELVKEQFGDKPKLIESNVKALDIGFSYVKKNFQCPLPISVKHSNKVGDKILLEGNAAAGLGCVYAGATVAAWYPITPSTSLVDAYAKYARKFRVDKTTGENRYAVVQAEDELSAMGMVLGAMWNGARAFTATSGPGVSLMSEFLGFAYYAEVPVVLFDVQRVGPSTGMPTRTQQSDLLACAYASHGDTKHVLLIPANPNECFTMAVEAFDLAERLQTPVIVLSDLEIGMNDWLSEPLKWDDSYKPDRGKVMDGAALEASAKPFYRYLDSDNDGIPYRTYPGAHPSKGAYFTRGSGHDKFGRYTEDASLYRENFDRLLKKWETAAKLIPRPVDHSHSKDKEWGVLYFGSTEEPLREALSYMNGKGIQLDAMRIRAFPFHADVSHFIAHHKKILVVEQNRDAQMKTMLCSELGIDPARLVSVLYYDGLPLTAAYLASAIQAKVRA